MKAWNKGLTKEDPRVAKYSNAHKTGQEHFKFHPRKLKKL